MCVRAVARPHAIHHPTTQLNPTRHRKRKRKHKRKCKHKEVLAQASAPSYLFTYLGLRRTKLLRPSSMRDLEMGYLVTPHVISCTPVSMIFDLTYFVIFGGVGGVGVICCVWVVRWRGGVFFWGILNTQAGILGRYE